MSQPEARIATRDMSTEARAPARTIRQRPAVVSARSRGRPSSPLEEFEQVYLRNVDVLMGYFARRCRDPQTVADLTSETFVRAMVELVDLEGLTPKEAALALGVSGVAFRKRLSRARFRLRKEHHSNDQVHR
jgi:DNA-directed RNA polymerase specialized sigma24 family protein